MEAETLLNGLKQIVKLDILFLQKKKKSYAANLIWYAYFWAVEYKKWVF